MDVPLSQHLWGPGAKPPARVYVLLLVWALTLLSHNALAADRRVAFVIGNATYASEAPLTNPHRDARLLAEVLRKDLGFSEVVEKRDLTRAQLFDLVEEVGRKARGADAVVVYYSGHGMRAAGGNYLIPVDARITEESHVRRDGIATSDLVDAMKDSGARVALLVLDACRNNPYSVRTKGTAKGLARMNVSGGNVLVAYATSENTTADDGAPGNSPYALALAQHLRDRSKPLLAQFDGVRRQVRESTGGKQNPTREGDLEVDVFLVPGSAAPAAPPRPASAPPPTVAPAAASAADAPSVLGRKPGEVFRDCAECPELVVIPPGSFLMGSPGSDNERSSDEGPEHRVTIQQAFAVGRFEVTQGEWKALMEQNPSFFKECGDRCPVEGVSWKDAQRYVRKLSERTGRAYRLLSEAEWEYVARAGTRSAYPWKRGASHEFANHGRDECCVGQVKGRDRWMTVAPVGQFPPNGFGLHDLQGNVAEWVQDGWHPHYRGAPADGAAWENGAEGDFRMVRGGSWGLGEKYMHAAYRKRWGMDDKHREVGFRVARGL